MAFLYRLINQLVYVWISKSSEIVANKSMVCKLFKAFYTLKQALKLWYKWLWKFLLKKLDLHQINTNYSIFVIEIDIKGPIVSIFIDDIKIIGVQRSGIIKQVKKKLTTAFDIIDIGPISFYLSLKIERDCIKKIFKLS